VNLPINDTPTPVATAIEPHEAVGGTISRASIRPMFKLFLQFASAAFSLLMIVYVFGWKRADSYYSTLGAPWITSNLKGIEFLVLAITPIQSIIIATFIAGQFLPQHPERWRKAHLASIVGSSLAIGLSLTTSPALRHHAYVLADVCSMVAVYLWGASSAAAAASIVLLLRHHKYVPTYVLFYFSYFMVLAGLFSVPTTLGRLDATRDGTASRTRLPSLFMRDHPDSTLYLLRSDDRSFYVVTLGDDAQGLRFAVVDASAIASVRSTGHPSRVRLGTTLRGTGVR
jgi:hypothetical protein